jgi:hypothetical protein
VFLFAPATSSLLLCHERSPRLLGIGVDKVGAARPL